MLLEENAPVFNLRVVFSVKKNSFQSSLLVKIKSTNCSTLTKFIIFQRNICNDIYYGKSKHHFKVRACEHLGTMSLTGKKVKIPKESAVFDHIFHADHNAIFDDFETLAKEFDEFRLLL